MTMSDKTVPAREGDEPIGAAEDLLKIGSEEHQPQAQHRRWYPGQQFGDHLHGIANAPGQIKGDGDGGEKGKDHPFGHGDHGDLERPGHQRPKRVGRLIADRLPDRLSEHIVEGLEDRRVPVEFLFVFGVVVEGHLVPLVDVGEDRQRLFGDEEEYRQDHHHRQGAAEEQHRDGDVLLSSASGHPTGPVGAGILHDLGGRFRRRCRLTHRPTRPSAALPSSVVSA